MEEKVEGQEERTQEKQQPDYLSILEGHFKKLDTRLNELASKVAPVEKAAPVEEKPVEESEEDTSGLFGMFDVEKIVEKKLEAKLAEREKVAKQQMQKETETKALKTLTQKYPDLLVADSELAKEAQKIMEEEGLDYYNSAALVYAGYEAANRLGLTTPKPPTRVPRGSASPVVEETPPSERITEVDASWAKKLGVKTPYLSDENSKNKLLEHKRVVANQVRELREKQLLGKEA